MSWHTHVQFHIMYIEIRLSNFVINIIVVSFNVKHKQLCIFAICNTDNLCLSDITWKCLMLSCNINPGICICLMVGYIMIFYIIRKLKSKQNGNIQMVSFTIYLLSWHIIRTMFIIFMICCTYIHYICCF